MNPILQLEDAKQMFIFSSYTCIVRRTAPGSKPVKCGKRLKRESFCWSIGQSLAFPIVRLTELNHFVDQRVFARHDTLDLGLHVLGFPVSRV